MNLHSGDLLPCLGLIELRILGMFRYEINKKKDDLPKMDGHIFLWSKVTVIPITVIFRPDIIFVKEPDLFQSIHIFALN